MAGNKVNMTASQARPDKQWNPGVAAAGVSPMQITSDAPMPPQPNTAILMNQLQDSTKSAKVRLRNLVDTIVGNEIGGDAGPTPSGLNDRLRFILDDSEDLNCTISKFANYLGIEV